MIGGLFAPSPKIYLMSIRTVMPTENNLKNVELEGSKNIFNSLRMLAAFFTKGGSLFFMCF